MISVEPKEPLEALALDRRRVRAHVDRCDERRRIALARAFGYQVVASWWQATAGGDAAAPPLRAPLEPLSGIRLTRAMKALAERIGASLSFFDAETAAYHVGLSYIGMLSTEHRTENGVYYTPPVVGARLIEQATSAGVNWADARVLDPACGGGAFLAPVARRMLDASPHREPRAVLAGIAGRLHGYEIDPFAAWLAQIALDVLLLPLTRDAGRRLPQVVSVCDTLSVNAAPAYDLVIGNPPYRRIRLSTSDRRRFERSLFGHANLYGIFTDVAIRHTKPRGVIAFVTPTSFLAGEYYKRLRSLLAREAPPWSFDFVAPREGVFDDVLQETLLATYRCAETSRPVRIHRISPVDRETLLVEGCGTGTLPADPSAPWILARDPVEAGLAAKLARMRVRLRDWGYGVSTGPLVWNRYKRRLVQRSGRNRYPVVWAESVSAGGGFAWRYEKRNHAPYIEIAADDAWMLVRASCLLLQRTTAKEQRRRLIAGFMPPDFVAEHEAVVVENHLNMVRPLVPAPVVSWPVLTAFLNSAAADRAFRCVSGSVAVSAYELESLPLPPPESLDRLQALVARAADTDAIDAECERLYDG